MYIVYNEEMLAKKVSSYRKLALILTLIITAVMAYFGVEAYFKAKNILADFSTVQASVTSAQHREERGRKGRVKDIYEVSYTFNLNSQQYSDTFQTNADKFAEYQSTGSVEVAYSNKNPGNFDRLYLLKRQSDPADLATRIGIVFVIVYLILSIFVWRAKSKLKKKLGQPMEVKD